MNKKYFIVPIIAGLMVTAYFAIPSFGAIYNPVSVDTSSFLTAPIDSANIANGSVSNTEFQYLDGVSSGIQSQLGGKQATITLPVNTGQLWMASSTTPLWGDLVAGTGISITTSTPGQITIGSTATTPVYSNSFVIESPTATEDDYFMTFNATSTIQKVYAVNKSTGDTVTFNLIFNGSRQTSTSTASKLFSSYTAVTSTTTPSCYAAATTTSCATGTFGATASTTVPTNGIMRLSTTAASSTQFGFTIWYTTP